jgi:GT2 family glycosyltransferase
MSARPSVSVIIVCTNERHHLETCLPSLMRQTVSDLEVIVVDNGSSDGSAEYVREGFPSVRVVDTGANLGYAGANNAGFAAASGDRLAVLNPDTEVEPGWAEALIVALHDDRVGMATSRVCHYARRDTINTCGNGIHLGGFGYCLGYDEPRTMHASACSVPAVSGCSFMMRRSLLDEIGRLDDEFFLYVEDTDFSIRARLAGYDIVYVPDSVVYHKYALRPTPRKFFLLERNRAQLLLKTFRWRTLAVLSPSIALTSALMWLYAVTHGPEFVRAKLEVYVWLFAHRDSLARRRAEVQRSRHVGDTMLLHWFEHRLPLRQILQRQPPVLLQRAVDAIFTAAATPVRLLPEDPPRSVGRSNSVDGSRVAAPEPLIHGDSESPRSRGALTGAAVPPGGIEPPSTG